MKRNGDKGRGTGDRKQQSSSRSTGAAKNHYSGRPTRDKDSKSSPRGERSERAPRRDDDNKRPYTPRGEKSDRAPRRDDDRKTQYKPRASSRDTDNKRPYTPRTERSERTPRRDDDNKRPYTPRAPRRDDDTKRPYTPRGERSERAPRRDDDSKRPYTPRAPRRDDDNKRPYTPRTERSDRAPRRDDDTKRPYTPRGGERSERAPRRDDDNKRPYTPRTERSERAPRRDDDTKRPYTPRTKTEEVEGSTYKNVHTERKRKSTDKPEFLRKNNDDDEIRLNRYISNSGVCSRRKADELITNGEVTVNGEVIRELGYKVKYADKIKYQGKQLKPGKLVYVLLNKPKDYITTMDDPQERRTVVELIRNASDERIFPVGRLDRNTTGLLLLTNDGDLADKLAHPRNGVEKIYEVELDKSLSTSDFDLIKNGIELEDGKAMVDEIAYVDGKSKKNIGIKIHIGRNRIVRRIFEHLGYEVVKLDRVIYAGLTKKDLPRGRHRHLTREEVILLKHFK